jgi:hypothetical protein
MTVSDAIKEALDLSNLALPESLNVTRIEYEDFLDQDDEPSLRVLVVIDELTDIDRVDGNDVGRLKMAILVSLQQRGVELFPYIFIAKPSELVGDDEDPVD